MNHHPASPLASSREATNGTDAGRWSSTPNHAEPSWPDPGPPGSPPNEGTRWKSAVVGAILAAAVALPVGVGAAMVLSDDGPAIVATAPTSVLGSRGGVPGSIPGATADPASVEASTTVVPSDPIGVPSGNANPSGPSGAPSRPAGPVAPTPASPPAPTGPAPVFTDFFTPDKINCHNGNFQTFTMRWATTNATKVTVAIDGPGLYGSYGPSAEISLPFNCSSAHSFLVTATGAGGATATKSITLQPRNVQPPDTPDTPDTPDSDPDSGSPDDDS